ncbi:MAG: glycosyltransferase family 4 protein [Bacteroidetes bacterium]|nr:glycosyltransferase family 4 protein [Fibrella sp.]
MKKIAFIVQRYGLEVNGGAEYHCRILAERLQSTYDIDILTTCSLEYLKWTNHYPAGATTVNGINVLRFPTAHPRMGKGFSTINRRLTRYARAKRSKWSVWRDAAVRSLTGNSIASYSYLWAKYQGPFVPDLVRYLHENHARYDVLIFFTYLYYPTIEGLTVAPHKSILIPTAHDEPPIYLPVFNNLFSLPKAILYNSLSEKRFVNRTFHNESIYSSIVGVGVEAAEVDPHYPVAEVLGTDEPYLIYIGRIDTAKGCDVLFEYFIRYTASGSPALRLVLVGQAFMPVPDHPAIIPVGFVDEAVKISLLAGAKALVIPSLFESLSMVTLESFAHGIPVIANGNCDVLNDHIELSKGGVAYKNYPEFAQAVDRMLSQDSREMAQNARAYVAQRYTWDKVVANFSTAVDYVMSHPKAGPG